MSGLSFHCSDYPLRPAHTLGLPRGRWLSGWCSSATYRKKLGCRGQWMLAAYGGVKCQHWMSIPLRKVPISTETQLPSRGSLLVAWSTGGEWSMAMIYTHSMRYVPCGLAYQLGWHCRSNESHFDVKENLQVKWEADTVPSCGSHGNINHRKLVWGFIVTSCWSRSCF